MSSSEQPIWSPPLLGAVLAGGRSRRLGRDKALEPIAGRTLVQRSVDALEAVLEEVVVVGSAAQVGDLVSVETVADLVPDRGPLGGIQAALARAGGAAVFVLACDLPFVSPELIRYLLGRSSPGSPTQAVVPLWGGRPQPLCALYNGGCRRLVNERVAREALAVHGLLDDLEVVEVPIGPNLELHCPELLLNVNRAEDLAAARLHAGGGWHTDE